MSLVEDTSIPFPTVSPDLWDALRLRGVSGKVYVWPVQPTGHGLVTVKLSPPKVRSKKSAKAGGKKERVKDVGTGNGKASIEFEIAEQGWPTFVDMWRLLAEERDGPWRLLHPTADTFDMRGFKVSAHVEISSTDGGVTKARCELEEIDPDTQAGKGASSGVLSPGAKAYQDAVLAEEARLKVLQDAMRINSIIADASVSDQPRVNGAKNEARTADKAVSYGKCRL